MALNGYFREEPGGQCGATLVTDARRPDGQGGEVERGCSGGTTGRTGAGARQFRSVLPPLFSRLRLWATHRPERCGAAPDGRDSPRSPGLRASVRPFTS